MPAPTIETERLVLRSLREDDLAAYHAMLLTGPVQAALHLSPDLDEYEAWAQLAGFLGQWELRGTGQWAVEDKASGAFVGRAGLHWPHRFDWPACEVGWTLHPDHWGRGYATEAAEAVLRYGFEDRGLAQVISFILPENGRSQAVAARLGMRQVEQRAFAWRPDLVHGRWLLTAETWRAAHP